MPTVTGLPARAPSTGTPCSARSADLTSKPKLVLELADKSRIRSGADWLIAQGLAR